MSEGGHGVLQVEARIVVGVLADRRQVFLGEVDHPGVDLDLSHLLDAFVIQRLFQHAAVAAADHFRHHRNRVQPFDEVAAVLAQLVARASTAGSVQKNSSLPVALPQPSAVLPQQLLPSVAVRR